MIFGGHDTWLKAIKPMLHGSVRYVGREQNFDKALLRNIDAIWIQPNAIAHKQYYRIINAARVYGKRVNYFQNASASKCVTQIAESEI